MWGKLLKKYLLIFLVGLVFVEVTYAAATKFTDLQCRNLTVTGTQTNTGTVTDAGNHTVTGNLAVTGTTTLGAGILPWTRTVAQLNALTPGTTNLIVVCTDCVMSHVCISSGSHPTTSVGAWTLLQSTAPTAALTGSLIHCQ